MRYENLMLSIIADVYMERLNEAVKKVYGVKAAGAVYSEGEELIQSTEP